MAVLKPNQRWHMNIICCFKFNSAEYRTGNYGTHPEAITGVSEMSLYEGENVIMHTYYRIFVAVVAWVEQQQRV